MGIRHINIKNWSKFQHYKDRRPTWIKLLIEIIDPFDSDGEPKKFHALPDSAKLTFILLVCLRANYNKHVPYPEDKWLKERLGINALNLQPLIDTGFICIDTDLVQDDTDLVQIRPKLLPPERERETYTKETETERERERACSVEFLNFWNSQSTLPKIRTMSVARKKQLSSRMKNTVFVDEWRIAVKRLSGSDFHTGKNDRGWEATVDWFLKNDTNWVKAIELPDPKAGKKKAACQFCKTVDNLVKNDTTKIVHCRKAECLQKLKEIRGW